MLWQERTESDIVGGGIECYLLRRLPFVVGLIVSVVRRYSFQDAQTHLRALGFSQAVVLWLSSSAPIFAFYTIKFQYDF